MTNSSPLKIAYRVVNWLSLVALVVSVVLVLRKSPAPSVSYDPAATARVQQELASAGQSQAAGTPTQVHLDSTEVNSYLHDNLQMEGAPQSAKN